jgi:hypothetical protein
MKDIANVQKTEFKFANAMDYFDFPLDIMARVSLVSILIFMPVFPGLGHVQALAGGLEYYERRFVLHRTAPTLRRSRCR